MTSLPQTPKNKRVSQLQLADDSTPLRMSTSSTRCSPHIKELIDPYLRREVKELSIYIPVDNWVEGVTQLPTKVIEQWTSVIKAKGYFEDPTIADALSRFCSAGTEHGRYDPLSNILNRLLLLSEAHKDEFDELADILEKSDHIDNLEYFTNDPNCLIAPEQQGDLAAGRKPDVIGARKTAVKARFKGTRLPWWAALLCFELKKSHNLESKLNNRLSKDKLAQTNEIGPSKVF